MRSSAPERGASRAIAYRRLRPGPGQSPAEVADSQRSRIQRAMVELIASDGYQSVTVRKLIRLAGVSTGTFYSHFDGTDDCLVTTYLTEMERVRARVAASRDPSDSPTYQAGATLAVLSDALLGRPAVGKLTLFEILGGGPAAVASVKAQEAQLEETLKHVIDRRGYRLSPLVVAWVTGGVLHWLRDAPAPGGAPRSDSLPGLVDWAGACLTRPDAPLCGRQSSRPAAAEKADSPHGPAGLGEDKDLIVNAAMKLARVTGYAALSLSVTSRAAGVPAARFKRCFAGLDDAYLFGVVRTARQMFGGFGRLGRSDDWKPALCRLILDLSSAIAAEPGAFRLVLSGILDPGIKGLTRREALIDDLADTWHASLPAVERPPTEVARASLAALWTALARSLERGEPEQLPAQAPTTAFLTLVPMVGAAEATVIVTSALEGVAGRRGRRGTGAPAGPSDVAPALTSS